MKRLASVLMVIAFAISIAVVARAAPTKQKAFTSNAAVEMLSPTVASVPVMTGYDVIQNLTEPRDLSIAQNTFDVDTSAQMRLSSTRANRSERATSIGNARSSPEILMIA
jgi:hypothetical protein